MHTHGVTHFDPRPAAVDLSKDQRRAVLVVVCLALALVMGMAVSLSVALPDLARDIGATQAQLQWIVNAYVLVFAGLLLPAGAMRKAARGLDGDAEGFGNPPAPLDEGAISWPAVIGAIDLHGRKVLHVVGEPVALRRAVWIEHTVPVVVAPTGGADMYHRAIPAADSRSSPTDI